MNDFVHCNSCIRQPQNGQNVGFFLGSCSHILCKKCVSKVVLPPGGVKNPKQPHLCLICKRPGRFYEINRQMPSQMMQLFRDPKDLCENYVKQIKQLLDFRSHHRNRLFKAQNEQFKKCSTMYKKLQVEYKKKVEGEKAAINESLRCQEQLKAARVKIGENERELARLRQLVQRSQHTTPSRHSGSRGLSTPSHHGDVTFAGVCTSTPIKERGSKPHRVPTGSIFGVGDGLSPIVSGEEYLTTPAMLGLGSARRSEYY
ncbi:hypothetical protein QR680_005293 [Steinernema hermaphroditum]|uniref:RING-type domain-containing protein n=1 Tax=Steinernema hermaphroditum TaxID=289476 RepID=A0AA39LV30_9BILA|nr:hypothetical protein QR680_005293 [Steinernema hermaphroditum]